LPPEQSISTGFRPDLLDLGGVCPPRSPASRPAALQRIAGNYLWRYRARLRPMFYGRGSCVARCALTARTVTGPADGFNVLLDGADLFEHIAKVPLVAIVKNGKVRYIAEASVLRFKEAERLPDFRKGFPNI